MHENINLFFSLCLSNISHEHSLAKDNQEKKRIRRCRYKTTCFMKGGTDKNPEGYHQLNENSCNVSRADRWKSGAFEHQDFTKGKSGRSSCENGDTPGGSFLVTDAGKVIVYVYEWRGGRKEGMRLFVPDLSCCLLSVFVSVLYCRIKGRACLSYLL